MKITEYLKPYFTKRSFKIVNIVFFIFCVVHVLLLMFPKQKQIVFEQGSITYSGTLFKNKIDGFGKVIFDNGDSYEGNFKNGIFHGQGTFKHSSGWEYSGFFENGKPHGQGKLTTESNHVYEGIFNEGVYQIEN